LASRVIPRMAARAWWLQNWALSLRRGDTRSISSRIHSPFRLSGRDNGILYHEVPVSSYPLFEFPPYDLALASRMAEVAEFYELDLLHVHYAIPHSVSALLARQMLAARGSAAALCHHAARH
jgi:hypothetical protein